MAEEFDFNPDFSEDTEPAKNVTVYNATTIVTNDSNKAVTINNLVEMTKQHIADDMRVREEMSELTEVLDSVMSQMTVKEMIEYMKVKLKERELYLRSIYDAYRFIQQTEIAREMLIGSDRRERVRQSMDNNRLTKVMGFLNTNFDKGEV